MTADNTPAERIIKHPGLVADARALGVSYPHLWMVLEGRRESKSLMARYKALKTSQSEEVGK